MSNDPGKHYRYEFTRRLTQHEIHEGRVTIKMDPYRICDVYDIGGGAREHALKKLLRGGAKGHSDAEMLREVISCAERGLEIILENEK